LPPFDAKDKTGKEAWYRYYANDGTFRVHRFLKSGAKLSSIGDLRLAQAEIHRALQIKPNAHWGREKYQLAVMDWMIAARTVKTSDTLAEFLEKRFNWTEDYGRGPLPKERREAAQGLAGLIVLGAAWRSADIFDALAGALRHRSTIGLSHLCLLRCDELLRGGAHSFAVSPLVPSRDRFEPTEEQREFGLNENNAKTLDSFYPKLRAEADDWTNQRDHFMESRFALGKHPDTDTHFWKGWHEPPAPQLEQVAWWNEKEARETGRQRTEMKIGALIIALLALIITLPMAWVWRARRKKRQRQTSAL